MKVVITHAAKNDLIEIGGFIRSHNPTRAASFVDELLGRFAALFDMPKAYLLIPRYEQHGIRRCLHRDYLIFIGSIKTSLRSSISCMAPEIMKLFCFHANRLRVLAYCINTCLGVGTHCEEL
ncbi:type II toxin-antitoxin system RelE/ParE family toxin [Methylotuvimicrobium buryatense]|uniref:type II toxin-antitoxin system RelE/ParE family toxin n=1 Tax=Methylotuvimicrobium buryatense TaxID=95641 RepID=UPI00191C14D4